jgi:hypothetical protein
MDLADRVTQLENALIHLSNVVERRLGPYERDADGGTRSEGGAVREWAQVVIAERIGPTQRGESHTGV